jgi:DNA polymerase-3 subunit delta'
MIIGHQKQWQFLKRSTELGKFSHAYLFCGQEKLGKKTLALEFAKLLTGQNIPNPDLILIEPEDSSSAPASAGATAGRRALTESSEVPKERRREGKHEIQISQIRDLIWKLALKPYLAPFKIAIIDQAHLMNSEAQNCFLKTLEEPKDKTILVLITEYPEILFPTILSRCEIIKFYSVPEAEIKNYLINKEVPEKEIQEIIKISQGRPGVAIDLVTDPQQLENQRKKTKELIKILNFGLVARFKYVKELSQNFQEMKEALNIWLSYFRRILLTRLTISPLEKERDFEGFSQYSLLKLKNNLNLIQRTNFLISTTNINSRLALENLMLEL